jgi:hypothetical protein
MNCCRFLVESAHVDFVSNSLIDSMCYSLLSFGLGLMSSTPFDLWAFSNAGSYSSASINLCTLDRKSHKSCIAIRNSEPQFLMSSKANYLAEVLHCKYRANFMFSEMEP